MSILNESLTEIQNARDNIKTALEGMNQTVSKDIRTYANIINNISTTYRKILEVVFPSSISYIQYRGVQDTIYIESSENLVGNTVIVTPQKKIDGEWVSSYTDPDTEEYIDIGFDVYESWIDFDEDANKMVFQFEGDIYDEEALNSEYRIIVNINGNNNTYSTNIIPINVSLPVNVVYNLQLLDSEGNPIEDDSFNPTITIVDENNNNIPFKFNTKGYNKMLNFTTAKEAHISIIYNNHETSLVYDSVSLMEQNRYNVREDIYLYDGSISVNIDLHYKRPEVDYIESFSYANYNIQFYDKNNNLLTTKSGLSADLNNMTGGSIKESYQGAYKAIINYGNNIIGYSTIEKYNNQRESIDLSNKIPVNPTSTILYTSVPAFKDSLGNVTLISNLVAPKIELSSDATTYIDLNVVVDNYVIIATGDIPQGWDPNDLLIRYTEQDPRAKILLQEQFNYNIDNQNNFLTLRQHIYVASEWNNE